MTNALTQSEVTALAVKVGFTKVNARIAGAIAMCEAPYMRDGIAHSNFDAVGDLDLVTEKWGASYGGMQVRSLRAHKGTGLLRDELRLPDPTFNLRSARTIKLSQGWTAWSCFTGGQFKAYLQDLYPPPLGAYVVVSGDTLSGIAVKLGGFTWQELAKTNGITSPYLLSIGQILLLPFDSQGV